MKRMKNNRQTSNHMLRRGNAMIMVVGILVLLVIVATAYIVRTNSGRTTSVAHRKAMLRDDKSKTIAEMLADIIALQLFVREYDGTVQPALSDEPLLSYLPDAIRYEADQTDLINNFTGALVPDDLPDNPYNFPPYHVIPFTNPPDPDPAIPGDTQRWPSGPGNPNGPSTGTLAYEGNPVGNPGFRDNRALADNEPLRWQTPIGHDREDAYSHWRHMSNIATANNGFRIVFGINDIGDNVFDIDDGFEDGIDFQIGTIIAGDYALDKPYLGLPFEQWLAVKPEPLPNDSVAVFDTVSGNTIFRDDFYARWFGWFIDDIATPGINDPYVNVYRDPTRIPPNFYNLSYVGLPQDEFIAGTDRHALSSVLADTDGDGFTDSFWMLAPTMTESGIRQVIAVRIIDNSAMLNVNVGTQFVHADPLNSPGFKTRSVTPADLLLVGDIDDPAYISGFYRVGYFDIAQHHETGSLYGNPLIENEGALNIGFDRLFWDDGNASFLAELGVLYNDNDFPDKFTSAPERLFYWQTAGSNPFNPGSTVTPFSLTEELELRAYHGQNIPWIASRLEKAIQPNVFSGSNFQFLHANLAREESSELLDQLNVRELLFDHRKRLTTYNGARNDIMPPWLWWRGDVPADVSALGLEAEDRFLAQSYKKLDLREMLNPTLLDGEYDLAGRLPGTLLQALTDGDNAKGNSYFGSYTSVNDPDYANTRRAAAAFAANILQWSDDDTDYVDLETAAIPLPGVGIAGATGSTRFLGIERQPFLVEALIAHVHEADAAGSAHPNNIDKGDHIMCATADGSTVIVVQIANPFDEVLDLSPFQLNVFGQPFQLPAVPLNPGASRNYYAVGGDLDDNPTLETEWLTLLKIDALDTVEVAPVGVWSTDRSFYDSSNTDEQKKAVEIYRTIGTDIVLIDRIDIAAPASKENFDFGESVAKKMGVALSATGSNCTEPIPSEAWDVLNIQSNTHWIQWSHVTRAWDNDLDENQEIAPQDRNPRYVFSYREVDESNTDGRGFIGVVPHPNPAKFDKLAKGDVPDADDLTFSMQMLQKDDDFEQIGELLNVFMFGHELEFDAAGDYTRTKQTFSEFMIDKSLVGEEERVNRLRIIPALITGIGGVGGAGIDWLGQVIGVGDPTNINDPLHGVPAVPAGTRVLDAFVCDGPGINGTVGVDDYLGANGFSGKLTPGLINVNTAAQEVMRAIPHNSRLVHETYSPSSNPHVSIPEAIVRYRERLGSPLDANSPPAYGNRDLINTDLGDLRGDRGIVSISELLLLDRPATFSPENPSKPNNSYRINYAGLDPYGDGKSTQISIDLNDIKVAGVFEPDEVAKDVEEQNLLFAGMSNLLTTRSDVFTVYFRIRSFRQNPVGPTGVPVWDATDPEFILDDSRYVMLVDRSEVNRPTDKPKILYLEKLAK